jgi:hypothetical protein
MDELLRLRDAEKDYYAAGKAMSQALKEANLKPPEWPPKVPPANTQPASQNVDVDDDIPL